MRVKVNGRYWRLRYARMQNNWGECDMPGVRDKEIRINSRVDGELELDTLIHELLHAAAPQLASEDWVNETAGDIARILWRLGYCRI